MLSPGRKLGRYEIASSLGVGGMGEVYRARDTELGREVALKVLPEAVAKDPDRLKRFEREARALAALSHPNVLTVYDVGREDGRAYLVFELLEGETLGARLRTGRLSIAEALERGAQIARGLKAAHARGIVHRDLKPDNLFLTTTGVVKILDFGLARVEASCAPATEETTQSGATQPGMVVGTVAYMSPEQAVGQKGDARSDVFSLGTVLFEMLSGRHPFRKNSSAETLTAILRDEPPDLGEFHAQVPRAVDRLVRRCLAKRPEDRFQTASDLALALEVLAQGETSAGALSERLSGEGEATPYPGLRSFTEAEADQFFGREADVSALWEKVRRQKLLALIGPSGVGKTSFLRAGVVPHRPSGWAVAYLTPGPNPPLALAQALAKELAGDATAITELMQGVAMIHGALGLAPASDTEEALVVAGSRWRRRQAEALLLLDQFEELFTLHSSETQKRFATLLGRLTEEAGVRVLLSLRDDFLFRCSALPALAPVFVDLTPLTPPSPADLRRALVEPAARRGVHFEDETLAGEMVGSVEKERGALPLLAFAVSRLWEERDREKGVLARSAYERIGGVSGALAQQAEATLQRIGPEREATVREIFRNLVTAEGTRAAREREDLLSVFAVPSDGRREAETVLDELVAARLLTEFREPAAPEGGERSRVEIVHESLLTRWPRLVRWQTQDADGAQLRDQLRQAAQAWQDRGRPEDLLWSGTVYRDFALWRERYPGGLTATEEAFAEGATRLAGRRRRRGRLAVATVLITALVVAGLTSSLWRRSETARQKAEAETLRAEASKLLALGQRELETYPTAALAYALKSLELADTEVARLFSLRILQYGPSAILRVADPTAEAGAATGGITVRFSPNDEWVATGSYDRVGLLHRDGIRSLVLGDYPSALRGVDVGFGPRSDILVANRWGDIRQWSLPEGREIRRGHVEEGLSRLAMRDDGFLTLTQVDARGVVRWWPPGDGEARLTGSFELQKGSIFHVAGDWLAYTSGRGVYLRSLARPASPPRLVSEPVARVVDVTLTADGQRVVVNDASGEIRIWSMATPSPRLLRALHTQGTDEVFLDSRGRRLAATSEAGGHPTVHLWDLTAPAGVKSVELRRSDVVFANQVAFDSSGEWLASVHAADVALWPLGDGLPTVLAGHDARVDALAFTPDGRWLVSASDDDTVRAWPVSPDGDREGRILFRTGLLFPQVAVDPASRNVAVSAREGRVHLIPLDGGPSRTLRGFSSKASLYAVAFGDGGRLVAAAPHMGPRDEKVVRVWNLETGAVQVLGPVPGAGEGFVGGIDSLAFVGGDRLLASSNETGIVLFDLQSGTGRVLVPGQWHQLGFRMSQDGLFGVGTNGFRFELDGRAPARLFSHDSFEIALDPTDTLYATGSPDGTVRVGPVSGGEPHLLFGHQGLVRSVAFSPDGRFVASAGDDRTIRLWPVPDVSKRPLHKRPQEEVLAALRSRTNLRVVPAPDDPTGWKLERGPFPGWAKRPEW